MNEARPAELTDEDVRFLGEVLRANDTDPGRSLRILHHVNVARALSDVHPHVCIPPEEYYNCTQHKGLFKELQRHQIDLHGLLLPRGVAPPEPLRQFEVLTPEHSDVHALLQSLHDGDDAAQLYHRSYALVKLLAAQLLATVGRLHAEISARMLWESYARARC